jgi:O-antigen/teichoic acid export membrane protein
MQPMTVVTGLACMGVPTALVYYIGAGYEPRSSLLRACIVVTPAGLITYALMALYAWKLAQQTGVPLWVYLVTWLLVPVGAFIHLLRSYWQGMQRWRRLDAERFSGSILRLGAIALPLALGIASSTVYSLASAAALVLASGFLLQIGVARGGPKVGWRDLSRYSISAWPMTVALFVGSRLDQALLPAAGSVTQLGLYAVAATVAEAPIVLATLIAREAMPLAARGVSLRRIARSGRVYWIIQGTVCLAIVVVAPMLIPAFFGDEFSQSVLSVQILTLATIGSTVIIFETAVLAGRGRPKLSAFPPLASVLCTVVGFSLLWGRVTSLYAAEIAAISQIAGATVGLAIMAKAARSPQSPLINPEAVRAP